MKRSVLKSKMETGNHFKNGTSLKSLMSKGVFVLFMKLIKSSTWYNGILIKY
jgi:hypothetical protein